MRILYLSISYVPSRRASSIQVMRMCHALSAHGHQVELVTKNCAARQEEGVEDDYLYYGVTPTFALRKLSHPENRGGGVSFAWQVWRLLRTRRSHTDLVYSRDLLGGWLAARMGYPVLFEAHGMPANGLTRALHRNLCAAATFRRLVVISGALEAEFRRAALLPRTAGVRVAHDGAEVPASPAAQPAVPESSHGQTAVGYVGHLYAGRGIELIERVAQRCTDCIFHVVGGTERDTTAWRQRNVLDNLRFHGFVHPGELTDWYRGFQILLMPYQRQVAVASGRSDTSRWMSPMKMFEYMAAGKAIISSDLPVLREVLEHERNALLVPPDRPDLWEAAIRRLQRDTLLCSRLGRAAQQDLLEHYTWSARARWVLDGL